MNSITFRHNSSSQSGTKIKQKFVSREKEEYLKKIAEICENVICKSCGRFNIRHCRLCRNCGNELRLD